MLDQDTKKRIDSARQILVGKVPDPKAQVEQITTALIYKFMDDMDRENEELGGKAKFLTGKLKQYSWGRLLSKELSGQERMLSYMDALTEFSKADQIPELFRTIFKGTFLPYRDPETLNLFLKEINGFTYDNSEELGNAFEYLLSILGSQGDAGQFRTPRHIIDFIVEVVDPKKNDKILDPACGTAGFLISAFKHIKHQNSSNYKHSEYSPSFSKKANKDVSLIEIQSNGQYKGDKLSHAARMKLGKNIIGYDISPDMVRLSLVNMYLHGFNTPQIFEYDSLTYEERWGDNFDVFLANPPFMSPKGGIRPHKRFQIKANRSEVLFVDYIAEHLTLKGRAGVIVPEGIIFHSGNAYKNLRKMLIEDNLLWAVVSLPPGVFKPYSGVKTSILFLDRERAKKNDEILFLRVSNDGFDLGDQRRAISMNDLPKAYEILQEWQKDDKTEHPLAHWVSKKDILNSGDYNLTGDRYRETVDYSNVAWPMVSLGEVCEIISGQSPLGKFYNDNGKGTPFYQGKTEFTAKYIDSPKKWTTKVTKLAEAGDILMSVRAPVGPVNLAQSTICIGRGLASIRAGETVNNGYLFCLLKNMEQKIKGNSGSTFDSICKKDLQAIQIPLPPLDVQKEIVAELDGYQRVIDGARQVFDNWKPAIKIKPDWEMVKFDDICTLEYGASLPKKKRKDGKYPVVGSNGITGWHTEFLIEGPAIIVGRKGSAGEVFYSDRDCFPIDTTYFVKQREKKYDLLFLYYILRSLNLRNLKGGAGIPGLNRNDVYRKHKLPRPLLKEQKKIVSEIENEQKAVESAKKLIEIHEQKIKNRIAEVWGE